MLETNLPTTSVPADLERLEGPPTTFTHPDDVLHSPRLSVADKRRILASWASDAHAVPDRPAMRQLQSGAIVSIDAILAALRTLDAVHDAPAPRQPRRSSPAVTRLDFIARWRRPLHQSGRDDDDDPPPCPASALPPGVERELRQRRDAEWTLAAA